MNNEVFADSLAALDSGIAFDKLISINFRHCFNNKVFANGYAALNGSVA